WGPVPGALGACPPVGARRGAAVGVGHGSASGSWNTASAGMTQCQAPSSSKERGGRRSTAPRCVRASSTIGSPAGTGATSTSAPDATSPTTTSAPLDAAGRNAMVSGWPVRFSTVRRASAAGRALERRAASAGTGPRDAQPASARRASGNTSRGRLVLIISAQYRIRLRDRLPASRGPGFLPLDRMGGAAYLSLVEPHTCTEGNEMSRPGKGGAGTAQPPTARWLGPLAVLSLAAVAAAQVLGFTLSPPERDMGHLQKILYVHVPAAWCAFLAAFVLFIFSVL